MAVRAYIEAEQGSVRAADQSIHQAVNNHLDGGRTPSVPISELLKDKVQERKGAPDASAGTEERGINGSLSSLRDDKPQIYKRDDELVSTITICSVSCMFSLATPKRAYQTSLSLHFVIDFNGKTIRSFTSIIPISSERCVMKSCFSERKAMF